MKKFTTTVALLATLMIAVAQGRAVKLKDYQREISRAGVTVVEYWAPWCGNCQAFKPAYNSAKRALGSRVRFLELNVESVDDVESTFGLKYGLPTLILFKNGAEIAKLPGGGSTQEVINWVKKNL